MPDITELLCLDNDTRWISLYFFPDKCAELNFKLQENNKYISTRVYVRPLYSYNFPFNSFKELADTSSAIYSSTGFDNLRNLIKTYLKNIGPVDEDLPSLMEWKERLW